MTFEEKVIKEFEEKFDAGIFELRHAEDYDGISEEIKSFLLSAMQKVEEQTQAEIIKKLEELKVTFPDWNNEDNRGREAMRLAWNQAVSEAIKIVEELKEKI